MGERWWPEPDAGDIVWCHFPEDRGIDPGPKPRPALIIKVFDDNAPNYVVLVAYGTSQKTDLLRSGEFLISNRNITAYQLSGLSFSTKFSFQNTVELPYCSDWFKVPPNSTNRQKPTLGVLHPSLLKQAGAAWVAVQSD